MRSTELALKLWTRLLTLLYALVLGIVYLWFGNVPSTLWWVGGAFILFIEVLIEAWVPYRSAQREKRRSVLEAARRVINNERSNFQQIQDAQQNNKTFFGLHQKAVEVYSYEETSRVLDNLVQYRKYHMLARDAISEIKVNQTKLLREMNVQTLLRVLEALTQKLNDELGVG